MARLVVIACRLLLLSIDRPCKARAYHGSFGIEKETVDRIKAWILI